MKWRRLRDSDTWHWCSNCINWLKKPGTYIERDSPTKPAGGEKCNKCIYLGADCEKEY